MDNSQNLKYGAFVRSKKNKIEELKSDGFNEIDEKKLPSTEDYESIQMEIKEDESLSPDEISDDISSGISAESVSLDEAAVQKDDEIIQNEAESDSGADNLLVIPDDYDWEDRLGLGKSDKKSAKREKKSAKEDKKSAKREKEEKQYKLTRPIGVKLIGITSAIIVISMALVTFVVSYFITADTRINAEENNLTINKRTSDDCENRFSTIKNNTGILYDLVIESNPDVVQENYYKTNFFLRNKDVFAISFITSGRTLINQELFDTKEIDSSVVANYQLLSQKNIESAQKGEVTIDNATPFIGSPAISMCFPITSASKTEIAQVVFSSELLLSSFSTGSANASMLVNESGTILVHSDIELVNKITNLRNNFIVDRLITSRQISEQLTYKNDDGHEYIGAFSRLSTGSCGVITQVSLDVVLEGIRRTTYQIIYLTICILSITILIIWLVARSLSTPLKVLTEVANEIKIGNINTSLFRELSVKRKDEIGVLARSTKDEQEILNTFTKLTNQVVTKAIVLKQIDFEPHLKDVTVFFSDIRNFTAISDQFNQRFEKDSAAKIISFLNDYIGRMVNCISIAGGTVDKFEGDAIMAVFGVLRDDALDFENLDETDEEYKKQLVLHEKHMKEDAINAIRAGLGMRYALMKYNKEASLFNESEESEIQNVKMPVLKIGAGINTGRATVGFMGSDDKMEFTSIGDAVNLASRTESSTKVAAVDFLIAESTYDLLKYEYIRSEFNNNTIRKENENFEIVVEKIPVSFQVKGKGAQNFYGVVNMPKFDIEAFFKTTNPDFVVDDDCKAAVGPEGPESLDEVRQLLGYTKPDYSGAEGEEPETKVKIQNS